jgi:hypothetical protein
MDLQRSKHVLVARDRATAVKNVRERHGPYINMIARDNVDKQRKKRSPMANMMDPLNEMMSIFANAPSIEMPDGSRMPLIPMDSM